MAGTKHSPLAQRCQATWAPFASQTPTWTQVASTIRRRDSCTQIQLHGMLVPQEEWVFHSMSVDQLSTSHVWYLTTEEPLPLTVFHSNMWQCKTPMGKTSCSHLGPLQKSLPMHTGFSCLEMAVGMHSSSAGTKSSEQVFTLASLGWLWLLSSVFGRALTFLDSCRKTRSS